jgi:hypothetical protein
MTDPTRDVGRVRGVVARDAGVSGQHHHVSARYLHQYAHEAAWKEDHRRMDNGALTRRVLSLALVNPVSRNWKG